MYIQTLNVYIHVRYIQYLNDEAEQIQVETTKYLLSVSLICFMTHWWALG